MNIYRCIENTISEHNLISHGDSVLVGLSGGADSVTLLRALHALKDKLGIRLAAAHINHSLRDTADRDMLFCRQLCSDLEIEFFCKTADIRGGAEIAHKSEELFARDVRYDFFSELGFDKIATAHNKNDAAETILFHFMRGAATKGLCGIPYKRGNIIRPLLDIRKEDIVDFCKQNEFEFMTDETNFQQIYSRNKIRLDLIPHIEREFNSNFIEVVTKNAQLIAEDSDYLEKLAEKSYNGEIVISELATLPLPLKRRILQLHFKAAAKTEENLSAIYIDALLSLADRNKSGSSTHLPHSYEAVISYGRLIIRKKSEKIAFCYRIFPEKALKIPETGQTVTIHRVEKNGDFFLESAENLTIRNKIDGDFFYPTGMSGRKRLSDFFTDRKIPRDERVKIPLLLSGDCIVSVADLRFDRRFADSSNTAYKIIIEEDVNAK